jgi:tRNA-modifying protein YgfZ
MACLKVRGQQFPILFDMVLIGTIEADYATLTEGCGLFDRSERGKLALSGADTKVFLQGQVSNDTVSLTPGTGCYAAFLTPKGKMLGDLRVLDTGDELLLDTERVALQELFNMIRRYSLGYDVELHKRTIESGLLALVGPLADEIVVAAFGDGAVPGAAEHGHVQVGGVRAIRTDVGIDLLCGADASASVRDAVVQAGAVEVGEEAVECVRIEHGRPRYGIDLDDSVIPQEAGLNDRAVSFTKGCYVGQETVARLFYKGKPNRHLRGLRGEAPLPVGTELTLDGRPVGQVTSSSVSPRFGAIALGFVRREAELGSSVEAGAAGAAQVVELPFS